VVVEHRFGEGLRAVHLPQDVVPGPRMDFDDLELLLRQAAGLVQNALGHGDLPDVVKKSGQLERVGLTVAEIEVPRHGERVLRYPFRVAARVFVFRLDRGDQGADRAVEHVHLHLPRAA